jgi:hypothetical protein
VLLVTFATTNKNQKAKGSSTELQHLFFQQKLTHCSTDSESSASIPDLEKIMKRKRRVARHFWVGRFLGIMILVFAVEDGGCCHH